MAFTTVTGSNGVTSLVGTTGIDVATIVTLASNVFVGGNTGNDVVTTNLGTGGNNLSNYNVRMGGGDDTFTTGDTLLNSFISLDGETIANDGNDTFTGAGNLIINSEIVGRGGNDVFTGMALNGSTVNGNTGDDNITLVGSTASFVYGGQGTDIIATTAGAVNSSTSVLINGNKGSDTITLAASGFANGSVYGGNGNDAITAAAVTDAAGVALTSTAAGVLLSGDLGNDNVTGSGGVDTINGGDGDDVLVGNAGADIIDGGAGADRLTGSAQGDSLTGGTGNDRFILTALTDATLTSGTSNTGFDSITDFSANSGTTTATINGDMVYLTATAGDFDGWVTGIGTVGTTFTGASVTTGGLSLAQDLTNFITAANFAAANDVVAITITGAVAWAGSYIAWNGATAGYQFGEDAVVKMNSVAGLADAAVNGGI